MRLSKISEHPTPPPKDLTFGWARATLLGAFFNGVFLLALGVSILVQAIERFVNVTGERQHLSCRIVESS